ncbi:hypothetical protein PHYSODRAFT_311421 [Phytophthora sojae]|uniref:Uncharacterized protein n=1 Tax=Phytophthora sojae (strain P6497) TaxID=1094619 RepID=G4YWU7_PHYSP|nr:hypothetical protein PHYSODRAFT_311421 [Phytophthora sojae]EGZ24445.1 hypothetical protein PHYSODRAFT_311421 [Phytophthora sojae]|eukprot:XP_009519733.1 hypothetical protein PHYSODRAFT_311421 [Phytophthora sojae]
MPNVLQQQTPNRAVAGGLARLAKLNLVPERYSRHMQTIIKLKQIRLLQVARALGSKNSYVIDVFTPLQSTTRIPTNVAMGLEPVALFRHPDAHPEKQFADFVKLRDELYESCRTAQRTPVQRFVESLLRLAVSCPVIDSDPCPYQEKLPRQLLKFLFVDSDPMVH